MQAGKQGRQVLHCKIRSGGSSSGSHDSSSSSSSSSNSSASCVGILSLSHVLISLSASISLPTLAPCPFLLCSAGLPSLCARTLLVCLKGQTVRPNVGIGRATTAQRSGPWNGRMDGWMPNPREDGGGRRWGILSKQSSKRFDPSSPSRRPPQEEVRSPFDGELYGSIGQLLRTCARRCSSS